MAETPLSVLSLTQDDLDMAREAGFDLSKYVPEDAVTREGYRPATEEDTKVGWSDYGRAIGAGAAGVVSGLGAATEYVTGGEFGGDTRRYFDEFAQSQTEAMAPVARRAFQAEFLPEAGKAGVLDNWTSSLGLKTAASLPSVVASIIPAGLAARLFSGFGTAISATAGAAAARGTAGAMTGGGIAGQIYSAVEKIPDQDLQNQSPLYAGYRSMMDEKQARQKYMQDVAGAAPLVGFALSAATGGIESQIGSRLGGAAAQGFIQGAKRGAIAEGVQESFESGGGEFLAQLQLSDANLAQMNWQKILSQTIEGGVLGATIGAPIGGAGNIGGVRATPVIGPDEAQQSALTSEITPPAGTAPPPPAGTVTPEPDTTPERADTLLAQQEKVLSGEVPAMYFPVGTQELALPPDLERIERPEGGVMHFDPGALSPQTALEVPLNQLLGYVEPKADVLKAAAQGVPTKVVAELNPEGEEVRAAIVTAPRAGEQAGLFEETASPGNVVQEVSPQQIQQGRGQASVGGNARPTGLTPTAGWKFHLNLNGDQTLGSEIAVWLRARGVQAKIGKSSGQEGKDVTIYAGERDFSDALARDLEKKFGSRLGAPKGEVLVDDIQFQPKVWGRFDADGDSDFHQYGKNGVPILKDRMVFGENFSDKAMEVSAKELARRYGAFYEGTDAQKRGLELSRLEQRDQETRQGFRDFEAGTPVYPTPGATGARVARAPLPSTATLPPTPTDRAAYEDEYAQYQAEQRVAQAAAAQEQQAAADAARRGRMEAGLTKAEQAIATARARAAEKPKSKARTTKEQAAARKAEREAAARAKAEEKAARDAAKAEEKAARDAAKAEEKAAKLKAAQERVAAREAAKKAAEEAKKAAEETEKDAKPETEELTKVSTFMIDRARKLAEKAAGAKKPSGVSKKSKEEQAATAKMRADSQAAFEANTPTEAEIDLGEVQTQADMFRPFINVFDPNAPKPEPSAFIRTKEQVAALRARLEKIVKQAEQARPLPDSIRPGQTDYVLYAKHAKDALTHYVGKMDEESLRRTNEFVVDEFAARRGDFNSMRERRLEGGYQAMQQQKTVEEVITGADVTRDAGRRLVERTSTPSAEVLSEVAEEGAAADRFEAALERLKEMLSEGRALTATDLKELSAIAGRDLTDIKTFNTIMSGDTDLRMPSKGSQATPIKDSAASLRALVTQLYAAMNAPTEANAREAARVRRDLVERHLNQSPLGVVTGPTGEVFVLSSSETNPDAFAKPIMTRDVKTFFGVFEETGLSDRSYKDFARLIQRLAGDVPVHVMSDADMDRLGHANDDGVYKQVDDAIIVRESALLDSGVAGQHVIAHEGAHAALVKRVIDDPLAIGQIQAVAREVLRRMGGDSNLYAFSNAQEFIAEAFSNRRFQELLMRTPLSADLAAKLDLPAWRGRSMWWGLLNRFARFLGMNRFTNDDFSAMHGIMSIGERLIDNRPPMYTPGWQQTFDINYSPSADREALSPFWQQESAGKSAVSNMPLTSKIRKDALLNKVTDNAAATSSWLSKVAILGSTLDQLRQQYTGLFVGKGGIDILGRVVENMQKQAPYARTKKETADALAQEFLTYARNNVVEAAVLVDLMMDATMSNVQLGPNANNAHLDAGWRGIQGKQNLPRLRKAYDNDIGPEARALYQKMVTYYRDTQNEMTRGVIGNVLDELKISPPDRDAFITRVMKGTMTPADEKLFEDKPTALKTFKDANEMRVIQGDYFPLMRQGDYVVVTTDDIKDLMGGKQIAPGKVEFRGRTRSEAMRMANNFIANSELRIIDRRSAPENSVQNDFGVIVSVQQNGVFFFESEKEALQWQREHAGEYDKVSPVQPKRDTGLESKDLTVAQFNTLMGAINRQPGVEDSTRDVMRNVMEQAAARMMSGNRVQQRRIARRNVLGASKDFARNLALYGQSTSGYLAKLRYMPAIRNDLKEMSEISKDYMDKDAPQRIRLLNELNKRIDDNEAGKNEPPLWMRDLMTATYLGKLFSPMYSVVNGMQPWMMTFPMLAGRYGSWRSRGALTGAYDAIGFSSRVMDGLINTKRAVNLKDFNAIAFDTRDVVGSIKKNLAKEPDGKELVRLIDNLLERGAMSSAGFELSQSIAEGRGKLGTTFSNVDRVARQLPQAIEDINRAVTAIATYRLAMQAKKGVDKSLAEAFTTVMNTQGDYSGGNAPRFFNNPVLRPALQFKKYAQMATYLLVDAAYRSFDGKISSEERTIARKQLLNVFTVQIAMAGMLSLPGIEIAKLAFMIAAFFGAGNGWDEQEERLRKLADDTLGKTWGELVSRGVITRALNIDLSKRLSLADMWTFGEPKKYDKEGSAAYLFNLAFGAPGGTILDAAGGVSDIVKGEWATGTAKIVPIKTIADALRASNSYSEGKVTNTELAMNIFGVRSGRQAEKSEEIGSGIRKMQEIERSYKELSRQYIKAKTAGERTLMRARIVEHNKIAPLRYKVFPNALDKRRAKNEEERVN